MVSKWHCGGTCAGGEEWGWGSKGGRAADCWKTPQEQTLHISDKAFEA